MASVVFASDWLLATAGRHAGHPFSAVPLLQHPELLLRLRTKVTTAPTETMSKSTGVPPHVMQLNLMTSLLELCQSTLLRVNEQSTLVRQTIFDAMEERAIENGQISRQQIIMILDDFRNGIKDDVREQIDVIRQGQACLLPPHDAGGAAANGRVIMFGGNCGTLFSYRGRFWDVPATFAFPTRVKRDVGWKLWLQGMPGFATEGENGVLEQRNIKPFRKFLPARLPKKASDVFKIHWSKTSVYHDGGGCWGNS